MDRDIRRLERWVHAGEGARQQTDPRKRIADARRRIDPGVGIRDGAVQHGEDDEDDSRPPDLLRQPAPGITAVVGSEFGSHVIRSEIDTGGVVADEIEHADQDAGENDRPRDGAARVTSLLAERRRGFKADEGENREDHPWEDRAEPMLIAGIRGKDAGRVIPAGRGDQGKRQREKDHDFEGPESDASFG